MCGPIKLEYSRIMVFPENEIIELNRMGEDGWEFIQKVPVNIYSFFYFKRVKNED